MGVNDEAPLVSLMGREPELGEMLDCHPLPESDNM
jgi:hypothetical protein